MKLLKSLNNNVAMVLDNNGIECIVIGRGISFNKKEGDVIDNYLIDKCFVLKDEECRTKLSEIVKDIPSTYLLVTEEIVEMIKNEGLDVSDMIYITLVDHISVCIEREKMKDFYENPLLADIKTFYKKEYFLATKANDIIEKYFGIRVSDAELGFLTLHIVNASVKQNLPDTLQMTRCVSEVIQIIETVYQKTIDKNSIRYERLVRHLMFLIRRMLQDEQEKNEELPFCYNETNKLTESIKRIDAYLYGKYGKHLSKSEINYLKYHFLIVTFDLGK